MCETPPKLLGTQVFHLHLNNTGSQIPLSLGLAFFKHITLKV